MSSLAPVVQNVAGVMSPDEGELLRWLEYAAKHVGASGEVTLRLVDLAESQDLNSRFRGRDAPTNVLSFGTDQLPGMVEYGQPAILGDIVICVPLVSFEAQQQGKGEKDHWAHLIVHGLLHLVGYDHERSERDAAEMEALERAILAEFGVPDPYGDE